MGAQSVLFLRSLILEILRLQNWKTGNWIEQKWIALVNIWDDPYDILEQKHQSGIAANGLAIMNSYRDCSN